MPDANPHPTPKLLFQKIYTSIVFSKLTTHLTPVRIAFIEIKIFNLNFKFLKTSKIKTCTKQVLGPVLVLAGS
jgi:hypothetical protein